MNDTKPLFGRRRPLVIAHRGASGIAPENTLPAFRKADGVADAIELDVRLSRDPEVVVFHDATLERITGHADKISELDYEELRRLDAGYKFSIDGGVSFPFRGQNARIPLLDEVLQALPEMPLIVHLKDRGDPLLVSSVIEILRRRRRLADGSVLITSFDHSTLKQIRKRAPEAFTGCSRIENARLLAAACLRFRRLFGKAAARPAFQLPARKAGVPITAPRVVSTAHALGMEVFTYTVNEQAEMKRFLAMGVDGIITNYPHRLRAVINRSG